MSLKKKKKTNSVLKRFYSLDAIVCQSFRKNDIQIRV